MAAARERELRSGHQEARKDHLPVELVERLFAGESPVRVWREHRGLSTAELARATALSVHDVTGIETGAVLPGADTVATLAEALKVAADELATAP